MTDIELIKLSKSEILTKHKQLYIEKFRAVFGYVPACASCSFSSDFTKFRKKISNFKEIKNYNVMSTNKKQYKLRPIFNSKILSFLTKEGIVRRYGRDINDEFAKDFLSIGSEKEIEDRKKMFSDFPKEEKEVKAKEEVVVEAKEDIEVKEDIEMKEDIETTPETPAENPTPKKRRQKKVTKKKK